MPKQTLHGNAAREALQRGLDQVVDAVKTTLGPRGRNVLLDRPGQPLATRDGVTVAKETANLPDPFENMGAQYAREAADATVVDAGDGTTTCCVILQAIFREGLKLVNAGAEPLLLADGIEAAAKACAETIKKLAIKATPELVRQAAIISTHGDVELGTLIAEATCKVGATGVLELQESRDEKTTIEHVEGFYFERGFGQIQYFANDATGQKCVLKNPLILISERQIVGSGVAPNGQPIQGDGIYAVAQIAAKERRPLLIIAEDLVGDALSFLVANKSKGTIDFAFVRLPGFGDQRLAGIEDLRIAIGAKRVHTQTSTRMDDQLSSFKMEDLGFCEQAVISRTRTVLINGGANNVLLDKRVKQLIDQSQEATNPLRRSSSTIGLHG
jgi:chaperonin GroEL